MILITGGSGFLGRHIVAELLQAGYEVRLLVRNSQQRQFPWQNLVEIHEGDVLDTLALEKAMQGVSHVIHAAAVVSFSRKQHDTLMHTNVEGTANVVDACLEAGVERLIHVSSVGALGKPTRHQQQVVTEDTPWNPALNRSKYGLSKYRAELEVYRGIAEGLSAVMVNPAFVLGPSHDWNAGTAKIFTIVNDGLKFYNRGINGYVAATDVAKACRMLLDEEAVSNGERFILCAENLSYGEVFGQIAKALGKPAPRWSVPDWLSLLIGRISEGLSRISGKEPIVSLETMRSGVRKYYFDGARIERLGFQYRPIAEVIRETAEVFNRNKGA